MNENVQCCVGLSRCCIVTCRSQLESPALAEETIFLNMTCSAIFVPRFLYFSLLYVLRNKIKVHMSGIHHVLCLKACAHAYLCVCPTSDTVKQFSPHLHISWTYKIVCVNSQLQAWRRCETFVLHPTNLTFSIQNLDLNKVKKAKCNSDRFVGS